MLIQNTGLKTVKSIFFSVILLLSLCIGVNKAFAISLSVSSTAGTSTATTATQTLTATVSSWVGVDGVNHSSDSVKTFEYWISGGSVNYVSDSSRSLSTPGSYSTTVTGLTCSQTYLFRAVTRYEYPTDTDNYDTSSNGTFTTSACSSTTTAPSVSTVSATSVTTTAATLSGNLSSTGGLSTAVGFHYGSSNVTAAGSPMSSSGSFTVNLTGLTPSTTYSYYATASNSNGSVSGTTLTFTTDTPATFGSVSTSSSISTTTTTATVSGSVSYSGGRVGGDNLTAYFEYAPNVTGATYSVISPTPSSITTSGTNFTATISGLTCSTSYKVRAKTDYLYNSDATDVIDYGPERVFTTSTCPGLTIATLSATSITSTSAVLNANLISTGSASTTATAEFHMGLYRYGTYTYSPGAISYTVTGLTPGTTYSYYAKATTSAGNAYGTTVSFTTAVTSASNYGNLHGYAWSSTIGWISLNCAEGSASGTSICSSKPYGVSIIPSTSTASFSGKAWSSNIGWISFDSADTVSHCGASPVLDLGTNTVSGWAWAMNGTVASGADGCIKFSHATTPTYGVTYAQYAYSSSHPYNIQGFAWGSTNIGWVHFFARWQTTAPTVDLKIGVGTAVPADYVASNPVRADILGSPATLVWTTSNTGSCTASSSTTGATVISDWTSSFTPSSTGGTKPIAIPGNASSVAVTDVYTITCHSIDGSADVSSSAYVTVPAYCPTATTTGCSTATNTFEFYVNGLNTLTLDAGSTEYPRLQWTTANIQDNTCTASASLSDTDWTGTQHSGITSTPETREHVVGPMTANEDFTLSGCLPVGSSTPLASKTVHVVISQPSCEVLPTNPYLMGTSGSSGLAISGVKNFGVVWHNVSSFPATTITKGSDPAGVTSSWSGGSDGSSSTSLTSTHTNVGVSVSGPFATGTNTAQSITINASSSSVTCTPATLFLVPFGVAIPPAASTTMKRPPWKEF